MGNPDDQHVKDEGPLETDLEDLGDDGETDTVPCPSCGEDIYQGADRCPVCGRYVVPRLATRPRGKWHWLIVALLLAALVWWLTTC